jgi:nucleoside-diphosphate-sugar epimerase
LKKRVLLTGASGFIGLNLISKLLSNDYIVYALSRKNKISPFETEKNLIWLNYDLSEIITTQLLQLKIDTLIHLAWDHVSEVNHISHNENQLTLQKSFMSQILESNIKNIIISGTCLEYGKIEGKLGIGMKPSPSTNYGVAKNNLRIWIDSQMNLNGKEISISWLRIFYAYGNGQGEKSLYTQLMKCIQTGEKSFNMSKGDQMRDFVHVDKVCEEIIEKIVNPITGLNIFNISSGKPLSVRKFVENILHLNNKDDIKLNLGVYPVPDYEAFAFWGE